MHEILDQAHYLVKERDGRLKAAQSHDIYDPHTGQVILECREEKPGLAPRLLRAIDQQMAPFNIQIRTPDGQPVVRIARGSLLFQSRVQVFNENNQLIGGFNQKRFAAGGALNVLDHTGRPLCVLRGNGTAWEFSFVSGNFELARVTQKWAGAGQELLTGADDYMLEISAATPAGSAVRQLILAAVICLDRIRKE